MDSQIFRPHADRVIVNSFSEAPKQIRWIVKFSALLNQGMNLCRKGKSHLCISFFSKTIIPEGKYATPTLPTLIHPANMQRQIFRLLLCPQQLIHSMKHPDR